MSKSAPKLVEQPPIERVLLSDLHPHPRNYQKHPEAQIEHIRASLRKYGQFRPVLVADDLTILAGHGLTESMIKEGMTEGDVRRYPFGPNEPAALKLLALDNELNNFAEVDDRMLTEMLKEVAELDLEGLLGTGFDEAMLAGLLFVTRPANEINKLEDAKAWAGMPEFEIPEDVILTIRLDSPEDRQKVVDLLGLTNASITRGKTMWSTWWPARSQLDPRNARFETEQDGPPE